MLRIQEVLKEKDMSQIDLANKMGLTKEGLNKQINGNPTIKSLIKIANAIGVDVRELIEPTKSNNIEPLYVKKGDEYLPVGILNIQEFNEKQNPQPLPGTKKLDL